MKPQYNKVYINSSIYNYDPKKSHGYVDEFIKPDDLPASKIRLTHKVAIQGPVEIYEYENPQFVNNPSPTPVVKVQGLPALFEKIVKHEENHDKNIARLNRELNDSNDLISSEDLVAPSNPPRKKGKAVVRISKEREEARQRIVDGFKDR